MTSPSPTECAVCQESFDEDERCPRLLPCYHSVCSSCIENLITNNNRKCPTCRKEFQIDIAEQLKVNFCAVDLIKHINDLESNAISPDMYHEAPRPKKIEFLKKQNTKSLSSSLEECQKTLRVLKQSVEKNEILKDSIKSINKELKEEILDKVSEVVSRNDSKVEALEVKNNVLRDQQKELEELRDELLRIKDKLSTCSSESYMEVAPVLDEAEKRNGELKRKIDYCKAAIKKKFTLSVKDDGITGSSHALLQEPLSLNIGIPTSNSKDCPSSSNLPALNSTITKDTRRVRNPQQISGVSAAFTR